MSIFDKLLYISQNSCSTKYYNMSMKLNKILNRISHLCSNVNIFGINYSQHDVRVVSLFFPPNIIYYIYIHMYNI